MSQFPQTGLLRDVEPALHGAVSGQPFAEFIVRQGFREVESLDNVTFHSSEQLDLGRVLDTFGDDFHPELMG